MPLTFFKGDVLASSNSTDWISASCTFLGIQVTEAVEAIREVVPRSEALSRQLILASCAEKAILVPGLITVSHSSSGDGLLALHTLHGKLLLIARHTVVLIVLGNKALGSNGLLATLADEAGLMPAVAFMLHLASAWHNSLLALMAFGGVLIGIALGAQQLLLLGREGLVYQ